MLEDTPAAPTESVESIAQRRPQGALVISAIAVAVVVAIWFAFYFLVFLPRGFTR